MKMMQPVLGLTMRRKNCYEVNLPSISLKLLPMLGVPSLPSFLPFPRGLSRANSERCLGLSGPGPAVDGRGASLAELAREELTS